MANNYIEEFFISIGFDTAKTKKEAKKIEDILDGVLKKTSIGTKNQEGLEKKVHKNKMDRFSKQQKAQKLNDSLLKSQFKSRKVDLKDEANYTATVSNAITKREGVESKKRIAEAKVEYQKRRDLVRESARESAWLRKTNHPKASRNPASRAETSAFGSSETEQFSKQQKAQRQNDGILKNQFKQQKSILKEEADNIRKEAENLRKAERLAGIDRVGAAKKHERIKKSSAYMKAEDRGLLGSISGSMDRAAAGGQLRSLERLEYQLKKTVSAEAKLERQHKKLNVAQKGLTDSTRNMIRSYASVFALFQGTVAIKRVGEDFESLRASMLVVSDSEEDAGKKMEFVREQAFKLGVDLKTAGKAYLALSASSEGAMGEDGVKGLFTSVMSISKAFGMSMDDTKGTFKAFTQMLSKGNVQAEELRGQLG